MFWQVGDRHGEHTSADTVFGVRYVDWADALILITMRGVSAYPLSATVPSWTWKMEYPGYRYAFDKEARTFAVWYEDDNDEHRPRGIALIDVKTGKVSTTAFSELPDGIQFHADQLYISASGNLWRCAIDTDNGRFIIGVPERLSGTGRLVGIMSGGQLVTDGDHWVSIGNEHVSTGGEDVQATVVHGERVFIVLGSGTVWVFEGGRRISVESRIPAEGQIGTGSDEIGPWIAYREGFVVAPVLGIASRFEEQK